jgi:hypothetical protein
VARSEAGERAQDDPREAPIANSLAGRATGGIPSASASFARAALIDANRGASGWRSPRTYSRAMSDSARRSSSVGQSFLTRLIAFITIIISNIKNDMLNTAAHR